jgi:hypothetical protein
MKAGKRRWIWLAVGGVIFLVGVGMIALYPGAGAWSPVNCWHYDVDIRTGKTRYLRYLFLVNTRTEIKDSALSLALSPEERTDIPPEWRRVNTFSPGVHHSPHYTYHGALNQIRELEGTWEMFSFTPEQKRKSARDVLALWQRSGSDSAVSRYLGDLFNGLNEKNGSDREEYFRNFQAVEVCSETNKGDIVEITLRYPDGTLMERREVSVRNGERVSNGRVVTWNKFRRSGEDAVFRSGALVKEWSSITNYPE